MMIRFDGTDETCQKLKRIALFDLTAAGRSIGGEAAYWVALTRALLEESGYPGLRLAEAADDCEDVAFAVRLARSDPPRAIELHFDTPLVRALVDPLLGSLAGTRGHGPPTPIELGALEFLVLERIDRLGDLLTGWRIASFEPNPSDEPRGLRCAVEIGVQGGTLTICASPVLNGALISPSLEQSAKIVAHIALPAIPLSEIEWQRVEPGAVLLTDLSALPGAAIEIRAEGGAPLADGVIRTDAATHTDVTVTAVHDRFQSAAPHHPNALVPMLGACPVSRDTFVTWDFDTCLNFAKHHHAPVLLVHNERECGTGELVALDDTLGVRVLTWSHSATECTHEPSLDVPRCG
jgi:hypothetical protein